jgi:hypothetical protein
MAMADGEHVCLCPAERLVMNLGPEDSAFVDEDDGPWQPGAFASPHADDSALCAADLPPPPGCEAGHANDTTAADLESCMAGLDESAFLAPTNAANSRASTPGLRQAAALNDTMDCVTACLVDLDEDQFLASSISPIPQASVDHSHVRRPVRVPCLDQSHARQPIATPVNTQFYLRRPTITPTPNQRHEQHPPRGQAFASSTRAPAPARHTGMCGSDTCRSRALSGIAPQSTNSKAQSCACGLAYVTRACSNGRSWLFLADLRITWFLVK